MQGREQKRGWQRHHSFTWKLGPFLGELESPLLDTGQCLPCSRTSQASGLLATQWFMFLHFIWWPRLQAVSPASGKAQNQEPHVLIFLPHLISSPEGHH